MLLRRGEVEERKAQFFQPEAGTGGLLEAVPSRLPAAQEHLFGHRGERSQEANCQGLFGMRGWTTAQWLACYFRIFCPIIKSISSKLLGLGWRHESPTTWSVWEWPGVADHWLEGCQVLLCLRGMLWEKDLLTLGQAQLPSPTEGWVCSRHFNPLVNPPLATVAAFGSITALKSLSPFSNNHDEVPKHGSWNPCIIVLQRSRLARGHALKTSGRGLGIRTRYGFTMTRLLHMTPLPATGKFLF